MNHRQHGPVQLQATLQKRLLKAPFHITGYTFTAFEAVVVSLRDNGATGRGEAAGVYYHHDTPVAMLNQIEALRGRIESGVSRDQLLDWLPAGGARNALDCALWELEARQAGVPVWKLAGLEPPRPLPTTFTIGANDPSAMAAQARTFAEAGALKLKLTDDEFNSERVRAVRAARPDAWIMVDANQGLTRDSFQHLLPALQQTRIALLEQPFPVGSEAWLDDLGSPIRIAADESVQDHGDLQELVGRVATINIKLDKCGGLTEALVMARQAQALGFDLMVGNMGGSSLAMAPAFVLGQLCKIVDLDGPICMRDDHSPPARYRDGTIWCADDVWGGPLAVAA